MLSEWLAPTPVGDFLRGPFHRQPFALPGAARGAVPLFGWETLGRVLAADPAPDLLVVTGGRLLDEPAPPDLAAARAQMERGLGYVIRRAERHDAGLAALAAAFARDLPGEVHLQLFVTPAGTNGFGWHYDFEDVFIVQTEGVKDYYLRENSVDLATPRDKQPDFGAFKRETKPLSAARLHVGDWLYVPARWWHIAKCLETSLSISVGVFPA